MTSPRLNPSVRSRSRNGHPIEASQPPPCPRRGCTAIEPLLSVTVRGRLPDSTAAGHRPCPASSAGGEVIGSVPRAGYLRRILDTKASISLLMGQGQGPPRRVPPPGPNTPAHAPAAVLPWTTPIPRPAPGSGERAAKLVHPDLIPELDRLEPSLKDVTRRRCAPWNPTDSRGSNRRCVSRGVIRRITPAVRHGCSSTRTRVLGPEPPHGQPSPDLRRPKIPASADGPSSAGPGRYRARRPRPPKPKRLGPA